MNGSENGRNALTYAKHTSQRINTCALLFSIYICIDKFVVKCFYDDDDEGSFISYVWEIWENLNLVYKVFIGHSALTFAKYLHLCVLQTISQPRNKSSNTLIC